MMGMGRGLILFGAVMVIVGVVALFWERLGLPTRLPGDFVFRRGSLTVSFPLVTCLLLSLLLTVLLNLFLRRR